MSEGKPSLLSGKLILIQQDLRGCLEALRGVDVEVEKLKTDWELPGFVLASAIRSLAHAADVCSSAVPLVERAELEDEKGIGYSQS